LFHSGDPLTWYQAHSNNQESSAISLLNKFQRVQLSPGVRVRIERPEDLYAKNSAAQPACIDMADARWRSRQPRIFLQVMPQLQRGFEIADATRRNTRPDQNLVAGRNGKLRRRQACIHVFAFAGNSRPARICQVFQGRRSFYLVTRRD
jgi:hypothetical protein